MSQLLRDLEHIISGEVSDSTQLREQYSTDASIFRVVPAIIVTPKDTTDIKKLVTYATSQKDKQVSLTPRLAGTDMSGGPLSESIVVDMKKHFIHLHKIGHDWATVEPGMMYRDFEKQTLKKGLLLPCYPASRELCTIGGIFANNAGGEKSFTYGKAEKWIKSMKVVLADGNEYTIEPLTKTQLETKIKSKSFESSLYRQVFELCESNYAKIQKAKPNVSKDSTGYPLWNVWDKKTFDLNQLFVGSQGTLGIITELTVKLIKPKPKKRLLVVFLHDLDNLADIVNRIIPLQPESFECYDDKTLKLAFKFLPEIATRIPGQNGFSLLTQFIPELATILRYGMPKLFLLAEFTGDSQSVIDTKARKAQTSLSDLNLTTLVPSDSLSQKKYWVVRRESFNLLRHHVRHAHTAPFIDDVCVRPDQLPEFLPKLKTIMSDYDLQFTIAGHIGDANFHIFPLMDFRDQKIRAIVPELSKRVFNLVFEFGGTMSGEHNDGIVRTPYLTDMYGPEIVRLFRATKQIFDSNNIFNPGKKVDLSLEYANSHILNN